MGSGPEGAAPGERANLLLRRDDWRFALRQADRPGESDLLSLGHPSRAELQRAHAALRPGGTVHCRWRVPLPGAARRARRALERAGFEEVRLHWAWPVLRGATPRFWLPLDAPAAAEHLFDLRPAASHRQAVVRRLWRLAARTGALAPLSVTARKPGASGDGSEDEIEDLLDGLTGAAPSPRSWLLLTAGRRSVNKVVGVPFGADRPQPAVVVKFARVAEAERGLRREVEALRTVATERPTLPGVPRVLGTGRRIGRLAVAETAVDGRQLLERLEPGTFAELASSVTGWLLRLAAASAVLPRETWWERLVQAPLEDLERHFGAVAAAGTAARTSAILGELPDLPLVCEHRDCSPWNVVLADDGTPSLLDWESAEPRGLPGLDLCYFLANASFVLEGALESGDSRGAYARMLDPSTPTGEVYAACAARYCEQLGLEESAFLRLRALCWLVHCRSDFRHAEIDGGGAASAETLGGSLYLGLLEEDLARLESR
jgi:Phosphotransferase enzyme family